MVLQTYSEGSIVQKRLENTFFSHLYVSGCDEQGHVTGPLAAPKWNMFCASVLLKVGSRRTVDKNYG